MAASAEAYVDTSALIALVDRSDSYHALFRRLFSNPPRLVTTPLVVAEGHGWFLRRYDSERGLHFLALVEALKPLRVISTGLPEQRAAAQILRRFSDQRLTLTDAVGLHVMEVHGIRICWATDRHLGLTGVRLVTHEA